jgi:hypothetical protein
MLESFMTLHGVIPEAINPDINHFITLSCERAGGVGGGGGLQSMLQKLVN